MERHHRPTARQLLAQNPYTPTAVLAGAIQSNSDLLQELIIVKEWLHEIAPDPQHPEATTGYWRFTKYAVMQAHRSGAGSGGGGVVKEMDPDVVGRGEGRGALAGDDSVRDLHASVGVVFDETTYSGARKELDVRALRVHPCGSIHRSSRLVPEFAPAMARSKYSRSVPLPVAGSLYAPFFPPLLSSVSLK